MAQKVWDLQYSLCHELLHITFQQQTATRFTLLSAEKQTYRLIVG